MGGAHVSYAKTIVCLANSYKPPNGRCIAGREVVGNGYGGWIRPVSDRPTAEVSFSEYRYENGESPKLLDIIDVPLLRAVPQNHQVENHVIDATRRWVKRGELRWDELEQLRDRPASIWTNSDHTNAGHYDCISQAEAATLKNSLLLIKKKNFTVEIGRNYFTGKKTYRGKFDYKGTHHSFSLTDPVARDAFAAKEEGDYPLEDIYLCISLTEPYDKDARCHKLVAAIITERPL
jgi:hypothetical protein